MENFDHNSAENYNFDKGQIWKFKMPVWNLLDDDKNWVEKSKTQKSLGVNSIIKILLVKNKGLTKRRFCGRTNLTIQNAGPESIRWWQ